MATKRLLTFCMIALAITACGNNSSRKKGNLTDINAQEDKSGRVNVIGQAKPTLMVIPSDQYLQAAGFLKTSTVNGRTVYERDYTSFVLNNDTNKDIVRTVQNYFIKLGYPLTDLEQSLKSLNVQSNMDDADNIGKDAKTLLMETCHPDLVIEFDYDKKNEFVSRTTKKTTIDYSMAALDAFSNKTVASFVKTNLDGDFTTYLEKQLPKDLSGFVDQIKDYFTDIIVNGRDITFRVAVAADSAINLSDEYNDVGDSYTDWIREWIKTNAKNGTASLNRNTDKEMFYTSVRITNNDEDGTQFNAYDFANKFRKEFVRTFNLRCTNSTQGLGDAYVIIK